MYMPGQIFAHLFCDIIWVIIYVLIFLNLWVRITQYYINAFVLVRVHLMAHHQRCSGVIRADVEALFL
jgi:hypothetical protein